ncbi:MAG: NAD-binding protein [Desulfobulbaceae bacterium]|nr:NAD-binding protein [Desulfobulbaceae bacterium]
MRVLIAGAGKTARELLRHLARSWTITLIDLNHNCLDNFDRSPQVARRIHGDASSRLTLDKAGLEDHDFVVAVTNNDEVNLEVCRLAREANTVNIIALVNDSLNIPEFQKINVRAICSTAMVGRAIELFLDSPRLNITTIADGAGEVMEVEVLPKAPAVGKQLHELAPRDWLVAAVHRDKELIIPHGNTFIRAGDRLTIVGHPDLYRSIAHFFSISEPCFPLEYGREVLVPVNDDSPNFETRAREALYLVRGTKAKELTILASESTLKTLEKYKPSLENHTPVNFRITTEPPRESTIKIAKTESIGCVVFSPKPLVPLARFLGFPTIIAFAHKLDCPMLVSRGKTPYNKILVPYSATDSSGLALETAIDLAQQVDARVDIIVVTDPVVHQGIGSPEWADDTLERARDIARMHHFAISEVLRAGNVIREIIAESEKYDLLIIGSTTHSGSLLRPHIGEYLVQDASCSVLVVT